MDEKGSEPDGNKFQEDLDADEEAELKSSSRNTAGGGGLASYFPSFPIPSAPPLTPSTSRPSAYQPLTSQPSTSQASTSSVFPSTSATNSSSSLSGVVIASLLINPKRWFAEISQKQQLVDSIRKQRTAVFSSSVPAPTLKSIPIRSSKSTQKDSIPPVYSFPDDLPDNLSDFDSGFGPSPSSELKVDLNAPFERVKISDYLRALKNPFPRDSVYHEVFTRYSNFILNEVSNLEQRFATNREFVMYFESRMIFFNNEMMKYERSASMQAFIGLRGYLDTALINVLNEKSDFPGMIRDGGFPWKGIYRRAGELIIAEADPAYARLKPITYYDSLELPPPSVTIGEDLLADAEAGQEVEPINPIDNDEPPGFASEGDELLDELDR
jgi:hypothetical protein